MRKLGITIARARVAASGTGVQRRVQAKAVLGWAWKGIGLGWQSDSAETLENGA